MNNNNTVSEKDLQNDERLSAYLRSQMSAAEESAFVKDLDTDEELRSQAVSMAHLAKAMKQVGQQQDEDVKEALLSADEDNIKSITERTILNAREAAGVRYRMVEEEHVMSKEEKEAFVAANRRREAIRHRLVRVVSLAACVVILAGIGIHYYNFRTVTDLGNTYGTAFVSQPAVTRGCRNEAAAKELATLYVRVQSGTELDATIKRLSILWELSTMDTFNDYTNEAPLIGWNLAIAHLKAGNKDEAKQVLTQLVSKTDPASAVNAKARELLAKLE